MECSFDMECSINVECSIDMNMQHGHGMQYRHGHGHAARICGMDLDSGHAWMHGCRNADKKLSPASLVFR
jgi:hypothetical protein